MHGMDLNGLLVALGGLIGTLVAGYKAFGSSKKQRFIELEKTVKELKEDTEIYRKRWLQAEEANDQLRKELDDAQHKSY